MKLTTMISSVERRGSKLEMAECPCCRQQIAVHSESIHIGAEILCVECSSILWIEITKPLTLAEVEFEEENL